MTENLGIADKVNINSIVFEKIIKCQTEKAIVTYAKSTHMLTFNVKMVEFLNIKKWTHILAGVDESSGIVILKLTDAEEFGSVMVRPGRESRKEKQHQERAAKMRIIYIGHLIKSGKLKIDKTTAFKAERSGEMIFLQEI
jgi:hypothetical protein